MYLRTAFRAWTALALLLVLAGCGDGTTEPPRRDPVAGITLRMDPRQLTVGQSVQATATLVDRADRPLSGGVPAWASTHPAIASVSEGGLVTGMSPGMAAISATIDGRSTSVQVVVMPVPIATLAIDPPAPSVPVGGTVQVRVIARDAAGNELPGRPATLTSSNPSVASLNAGTVTGLAVGTTTLTATADGKTATATLTVTAPLPATGLSVAMTSPMATNEFIVSVDGGGLATPQVAHMTGSAMTTATLHLSLPAGGPYRVRAVAVDPRSGVEATFPITAATGMAEGVRVAANTRVERAIALAAPTVQLTAPTQVSGGEQFDITWTVTDPGAALDRASLDGRVWYTTSPGSDLVGSQLHATGTRLSATSYRFTARMTAPITPGAFYFQVAAQIFDIPLPGRSRAGWHVSPSLSRGETLRQVVVPVPTTGISVALTSPTPTNEFIVAVDGGSLTTPQTAHVTSSSMTSATLHLSVPAGGPYRVRAVAVDPRSGVEATFPITSASGMAEGVTVAANTQVQRSIALAAPTVQITAPTEVAGGEQFEITWTVTDPGAALDRPSLDGRVWYGTAPTTDMAGSQLHATATRLSPTSYRFVARMTAPITPGAFRFQVASQIFDLRLTGRSRAGWQVSPSIARGEALRTITVR